MRGPHNIWRLIRTGATFQRTGAMGQALDAMNAPARVRLAARALAWPFTWLGYKGDPALPPITRAITALGPDRKSTRLNSSHSGESRMPSSA